LLAGDTLNYNGEAYMLGDKIGAGITIGTKKTIAAPDGSKVIAAGIKLAPEGIALAFHVKDKAGQTTEYAATVDNQALTQLMIGIGYYVRRALSK
jgi:hypothetical protein